MKRKKSPSAYVAPGKYPVEIIDIREETAKFGPVVKPRVRILGSSPYAGVELDLLMSATYSDNTKFGKFVRVALRESACPDEFDDNDLIGEKIGVEFVDREAGGNTYSKAVNFLPPEETGDAPF